MPLLLITGGTGYLGSELVQQALDQGWEVAATYHSQAPSDARVQWLALDLRNRAETERIVSSLHATAIIHTAFVQSGPDLDTITAFGSAAVARAAQASNARLVHLSSDALFDGEIQRPYNEEDPPSPVNDYGRAKAEAERLVAEIYPQASMVRTSLIYGGKQLSKHEETILAVADGEKQFSFYSDEMRCPVVVSDLAAALLALSRVVYRGVLNIAGGEALSRYRFAQLVARRYGRSDLRLQAAVSPGAAGGRPRHCVLDSSRAAALLGIQLRGVQEALYESTP